MTQTFSRLSAQNPWNVSGDASAPPFASQDRQLWCERGAPLHPSTCAGGGGSTPTGARRNTLTRMSARPTLSCNPQVRPEHRRLPGRVTWLGRLCLEQATLASLPPVAAGGHLPLRPPGRLSRPSPPVSRALRLHSPPREEGRLCPRASAVSVAWRHGRDAGPHRPQQQGAVGTCLILDGGVGFHPRPSTPAPRFGKGSDLQASTPTAAG